LLPVKHRKLILIREYKYFGKEISGACGITDCYAWLEFIKLAFAGFIRTGMTENSMP